MVSKRSKTGDPACSQAMSLWQRARHSGAAVAAGVFQILAQCRAKARAMGHASAFAEQGNHLQSAVWARRAQRGMSGAERSRRAKQLLAERVARPAKAPTRAAAKPAAPAEKPFRLAQQSAYGRKSSAGFTSSGGRTGTLFDVGKKGELKGQTSLLERVGHVETTADRRGFRQQVLDAAAKVPEHKDWAPRLGSWDTRKVWIHHVHEEHQRDIRNPRMTVEEFKRRLADNEDDIRGHMSRADLVQAMKPEDVRKAQTKMDPAREYGSPEWHFITIEPNSNYRRQVAHQLPAPTRRAERVKTLTERRREERAIFPVQIGKGIVRGPATAVSAARARQERSFGASLFGGKRAAPDTGPVQPLRRSLATPNPKPGPAAVAARGRESSTGFAGGQNREHRRADPHRPARQDRLCAQHDAYAGVLGAIGGRNRDR